MPLGCEESSSGGGFDTPETGVFNPDGGGGDSSNVDSSAANECVPPTKGPTLHTGGSTSDPENDVWTADTSPHILQYDTTIYKNVTVEPCAEVLIADNKSLTVRGKLVAEGTATKRIHIGAQDKTKPFRTISTVGSPLPTIRLAYATLDGGGKPGNSPVYAFGLLDLQADILKPTHETLFVDHVDIDGSLSNGINLRDNAGFAAGSNTLVIKGSAGHPLGIFARSVSGIPTGTYTGNAKDQILLPVTSNNETINENATLHDRGVPYLVGHATSAGDLRVDTAGGQPPVTLTIEPGVTMRFKKNGIFHIAVASSANPARGSLVAVGTAAKPIVFTSDEAAPAAGDWIGLRFGEIPTATNKLDFVRVEYAGRVSTSGSGSCNDGNADLMNDGAIRITGAPPSQFITNTTIVGSTTNGIDRGWRSDNAIIDFVPTNTFTNVMFCKETYPPTAANVCPVTVPCP
jgi:hypothetical protein